MERTLRWLIALTTSTVVFVATWRLLDTIAGMDEGTALAWAGLLLAIASSPLVYWASKPILRAAPKLRSGQLVVGDIPREPVALQAPPHLIDELRRTLEQTGTTAITAISGLSGTGKT